MHLRSFLQCSKQLSFRRLVSSYHNLFQSFLDMPRELKNHEELKKTRLKIKEKGLKYVPGTISLQVLGSGALGAPKCLYVFTDQSRYLFNVGEGSQRLAHEHKMKLSKLEHIFITRPTWDNIGGLPGVALTIQDVGVPEVTLHGPEGTDDIFAATRRFVILKDLSIRMATCSRGAAFEDNVMTVTYVPIASSASPNQATEQEARLLDEADDVDYYGHERGANGAKVGPSQDIGAKSPVPSKPIDSVSMCYICKLKSRPGTLSLEACVEFGVPPGPLLGQLKNGQDITLANGTTVRSADVTTPDQPGPLFIVVDCPSEEYLGPLTADPLFSANQKDAPDETLIAHTVIHFTPGHIVNDPTYQQWMNKFPESTIHLFLNTSNACGGSVAVHRIQHMLNMLHPTIFPLLNSPVGAVDTGVGTLTTLHLRPLRGLDQSQTLLIEPDVYKNEPFNTEEFKNELSTFTKTVEDFRPTAQEYPKIVFFGTGSCIPNKTRNTSAILVHTSADECVLLDCGEGTFNQILRFYGEEKARQVLQSLRMVYISHLHADHHIGLVGLLQGRKRFGGPHTDPVYLLAPKQILHWLHFYHTRFEPVLPDFRLIPNTDLSGNGRIVSAQAEKMKKDLSCSDIATVHVRHCPNAFGVAISHNDGWKLTYSGDTMPCQDLVALGLDSDILIHEATMEDELESEARYKQHSTTSQALSVGEAMRAKFTILTHFSQRYAKLPRFCQEFSDKTGIAFDNMQVSMNELPLLSKMYPALKLMFAEHCDDMDAKAFRRSMKKELKRSLADSSPPRVAKIPYSQS